MHDPKLRPAGRTCLCRSCGRYFGGVEGFDRHRKDGACLDPDTLVGRDGERLFATDRRGVYVRSGSWRRAAETARPRGQAMSADAS